MQTVTLTINVPDDVASRFHALPADTINRFAVAALPGLLDVLDAAEAEADDDLPADIYLTHPLPPLLREPLGDALRAGFADLDAGRVTDGETFFAELREYAKRK